MLECHAGPWLIFCKDTKNISNSQIFFGLISICGGGHGAGFHVIKTFENAIRQRMAPFVDFPIVFASALTKQRIFKVLELAKQVYQAEVGLLRNLE